MFENFFSGADYLFGQRERLQAIFELQRNGARCRMLTRRSVHLEKLFAPHDDGLPLGQLEEIGFRYEICLVAFPVCNRQRPNELGRRLFQLFAGLVAFTSRNERDLAKFEIDLRRDRRGKCVATSGAMLENASNERRR